MKTILDSNEGPRDWQNLFAVTSGGSRRGARGSRPPPPSLLHCCCGTVYAIIYEEDNARKRSEPLRGITHP